MKNLFYKLTTDTPPLRDFVISVGDDYYFRTIEGASAWSGVVDERPIGFTQLVAAVFNGEVEV